MMIKIDLRAFRNMTEMYEQLMNIHEIPDHLHAEFLQQADNVLKQCNRIISSTEMKMVLNKKKNEEQRSTSLNPQNSY